MPNPHSYKAHGSSFGVLRMERQSSPFDHVIVKAFDTTHRRLVKVSDFGVHLLTNKKGSIKDIGVVQFQYKLSIHVVPLCNSFPRWRVDNISSHKRDRICQAVHDSTNICPKPDFPQHLPSYITYLGSVVLTWLSNKFHHATDIYKLGLLNKWKMDTQKNVGLFRF